MKKDTKEKFAQALAIAGVLLLLFSISGCATVERAVDTTTEVTVDKLPTIFFSGLGFVIGGLPGGMAGAAIGDLMSDAVDAKIDVEILTDEAAETDIAHTEEVDLLKDVQRELEAAITEAERAKTTIDLFITILPWLIGGVFLIVVLFFFMPSPFQRKENQLKKSPKGK